ncbi:hypothetical protein QQY24_29680 [Streptomyces sp. TG1A-8]|uniref:hypothetical protein n=1 Tax=Streptomyces sp. TG1A-8 TaxID=3051385 RepID=UPI00265C7FE3|nr:hypothetical protein [Streptomyces sp. TG1A-8]MDO0929377.1 hypothetical protein [Streptomyces sp. TG1A-8]
MPFATGTSPFAVQVGEFSSAAVAVRAGCPVRRAWPWPLHRDLALHRLLLEALSRAPAAPVPAPLPSTAEEGRR